MNHLKFNAKKISILLGMSTGLILVSGCSKKGTIKEVTPIVKELEDTTCFDEVMGYDTLKKIDQLQDYIQLSLKLNKIGLDNIEINANEYSLLSPYEIKKLMIVYRNEASKCEFSHNELSSEEFETLKKELFIQRQLVNDYIYHSGYNLTATFLLTVLKTEILDAKGLDENSYDTIKILPSTESHINDNPTGFMDYIQLTSDVSSRDTDIYNTLRDLYNMQNKGEINHKEYEPFEYNSERNKMIEKAIKNGTKVLKKEYRIQNGSLKRKKK